MKLFMPFLFLFIAASVSGAGIVSRDVTVTNAGAGLTLSGTLTAPDGEAPRGAIVLVTGSGPQNRDEEILGHRPFKAVAEHLSRNGFAVLRTDDRGTGQSTGTFAGSTTDDFAGDAHACLEYLDSCYPGVKRGIFGHSEGGLIAVKNASNPLCDFIITFGGPAWSGDSIVMNQTRAIAVGAIGRWDAEPLQRRILDIAKSELPDVTASTMLWALLCEQAGEAVSLPQVAETLKSQIKVLTSPWYRNFLRYDPAADIAAVTIPYTAINGSKDTQVSAANLETIRSLNPRAKTVLLDNINHIMLECVSGLPEEYARLSGDAAPAVLDAITEAAVRSVTR